MSKRNQIAMSAKGRRSALMLSAAAIAVVSLGAGAAAAQVAPAPGTLPTGGTFTHGTGNFGTVGNDMTVTQTTDRGVVNWGTFDIASDASVHFDQLSATSVTINRVDAGGGLSDIYGTLTSDGIIAILNPNGVIFGGTANVDVGGLIASTGDIDPVAFMAGGPLSFAGATAGMVDILAGADISIANAGLAAFVAPHVRNSGTITAIGGSVSLAAGETFTLDLAGDGLIELGVPTNSPLVENYGSIIAQGGRIQLSAAAASAVVGNVINTSGVLQVGSAVESDGVIVLEAVGGDIEIGADISGGDVTISGDRIHGAGDVDTGGALEINVNTGGVADTTSGNWIADAVGVIGTVGGGSTVNLGAGIYAAGAMINVADVTLDGGGVARISATQNGEDGIVVGGAGDGAVITGLEIFGQADQAYDTFAWGSTVTRGVRVMNGAENVTVTDNNIHDVRNGILIDGRNDGSSITGNIIDNTKSGISVQYTDGSNLTITGNSEGAFGNEWGVNVHLNGIWNGVTITPSAGALGSATPLAEQQRLLAMSAANSGMSVYNQAWSAANRTHVNVGTTGSPSAQGSRATPISTLQGGVNAVVNGGTVYVNDGTYALTSTLDIDRSLTLVGESEAGVIIDGRGVTSGFGAILVAADDVSLSNFTLYGPTTGGSGYGIKVQPDPGAYDPSQRLYNFSISDVTVRGARRAELDLNGVVGATINNFTADGRPVGDDSGSTGGAGVQITDSQDVTLTGVHTLGNAWGSVAIYQTNRPGAYDQQTDNITIDADLNTFEEDIGVFLQAYSTIHEVGQLNLLNFDYAVRNTGHRADGDEFTFFRTDLTDAVDFALNIGAADTSSIEGWSGTDFTNIFTVVDGLAINAAMRDVRVGGVVNVGAGTYAETVSITRGLTLSGAGMDDTTITGGIAITGSVNDLTLTDFAVSGVGGSNTVIRNGGTITDLTVDGVRVDGDSVAGRFGFVGGQIGGDISITDSEFLNINGWAVFDTRSGAGTNQGSQIASAVFSGNVLDNVQGHVAFRQDAVGAFPDVEFSNNTVTNVGNATNSFGAIFKAFNADVVTFSDNEVSDVGTSGFNPSGEAAYGAVLMVRGASQLTVSGNTFTNNHMVFAVEPNRGLPTATTFTNNTFTNNAYSIYLPTTVTGAGAITFGAGNNFISGADTVQHIVWRSSAGLDLTGVEFDGLLGSEMSLTELFEVEDLITHAVDSAAAGFAEVADGQVFVTENSGTDALLRGVNLAGDGDTVHLADGTHVVTSTVTIDESIDLLGQSRAGTLIDGSAISGYGMLVEADDVSLSGFTFQGNNSTSSSHYGIKVQPDTGDVSDRLHNFSISDVTIQGWGGTELDLNGVVGAMIDGVTADGQGTKGVGIALTDSADVTIVNSTTLNNLWGSVALYQTNRYYNQQLTDIHIDANANSFGEDLGVFAQSYSDIGLVIGDLYLTGFTHMVANPDHRSNGDEFIFFRTSEQDALDFAVNLNPAESDSSIVGGWTGSDFDGTFTVGIGNLIGGGTQALSIAAAVDAAESGNIVQVRDGTYALNSTLNIDEGISLIGNGQGNTFIDASGVSGYGIHVTADGVLLDGFTLDGPAANVGSAYGIKVNPVGGSDAVLDTFWITNVTVRGSGRAELDLNGVRNATIDGFTADGQGTAGAGIQITDSDNVVIRNSTTFDNAWGGVALYLSNVYFDQQLANITIEASNDFQEANSLFLQGNSALHDGPDNITVEGYTHVVQNSLFRAAEGDWVFWQKSVQDALDFAVNLDPANTAASWVQGWDTDDVTDQFHVGFGELAGGGTQALSIQTAFDQSGAGATVTIDSGAYAETATLSGVRTLQFGDVTVDGLTLEAGSAGSGVLGAVTSTGDLTFAGDVSLLGDLDLSAAGDLAVAGVTGLGEDLTLSGASVSLGSANVGGLDITGATTLTGGSYVADHITIAGVTTLTQDTVLNTSAANGDVSLGSVDGASAGGQDLTVLAGTGDIGLGALGGSTALGAVSLTGGAIQSVGVNAIGAVTFAGLTVSLTGDYATGGGDLTVTGPVTLTGDVTADAGGGDATLGTVGGGHDLSLSGASVSLGSANVGDLAITGATTLTGGSYVADQIMIAGATTLTQDTVLNTSAANGDVSLGSVDGASAGGQDLTVLAGTGDIGLGALGGSTALGAVSLTGGAIQSVGVDAIGAVTFAGLTVSLTGDYATGGGDLTVTGPVILAGNASASTGGGDATLGTVNGAWALDIDAGPGTITVAALGGGTALSDVSLTGGAINTAGATTTGDQSYDGAVTLSGGYATGGGGFSATGAGVLTGATSVVTGGGDLALGSVNGGHALTLNAGGGDAVLGSMGATTRLGAISVTAASTVLEGNVYAGSSLAFLGSGADSTVRLTRTSTTLNSTVSSTQAGTITIDPNLIGTTAGGQSVSFIAGSGTGSASANGDISIGNAGSDALRLGSMTVRGDDFSAQTVKLAGSYSATLTGNQTFSANTLDTLGNVNATVGGNESSPIIAGGSVNLTIGGTSTGSLRAGGSVRVTSGGAQGRLIDAGGPVRLTSGGGIGGSVTTPGAVTLQSTQNVDVEVNAGTVNVAAPGGEVTGTFTQITTDSGGTFVVNGETVVGSGDADARQFLADQFITPAGGVVGSTGQIQLPVGLAIALIAPAGEGEGQRRPIVVNSIEHLGELLRLGYTAIIVQIDDGSEPEYEQELDIALEGEVEPVA